MERQRPKRCGCLKAALLLRRLTGIGREIRELLLEALYAPASGPGQRFKGRALSLDGGVIVRRIGSCFHLSHLGERRLVGSDQLRNRRHLGIPLSGRRPDGLFGRSCSAAASKEKATKSHNAAAVTLSMNQRRSLALSLAFGRAP